MTVSIPGVVCGISGYEPLLTGVLEPKLRDAARRVGASRIAEIKVPYSYYS